MRILHTADWHLGQTFHNFERTFEHAAFLNWLLEILEEQKIDVLIVAGDVFDSANPPIDAQRIYYRFLHQVSLRFPHLAIVITAGNHDSPGRLEAPKELLCAMRVHVVGVPRFDSNKVFDPASVLVPIEIHGVLRGWCVAMPFLRSGDGDDFIQDMYSKVLEHITRQTHTPLPIVAMAHAYFAGGMLSDTERKVLVGGLETLSTNIFDNAISYIALGHLHRAQVLDKRENCRYSGEPYPTFVYRNKLFSWCCGGRFFRAQFARNYRAEGTSRC